MFAWFRRLMPREDSFFELFHHLARRPGVAGHAGRGCHGAAPLHRRPRRRGRRGRHHHFGGDARNFGDAIVSSAELLREAVPLPASISHNATRINLLCEQIRQVEGEADDIHHAGVAARPWRQ